MSEDKQQPSAALLDTMIDKMQKQDQRLQAHEEKLNQVENGIKIVPQHSKDIAEIQKDTQEIVSIGREQNTIMERLQKFFTALEITAHLLRHPVPSKVEHHHHLPRLTWIAAGLFLALCLVCSGWYITARTSEQYQANDIKYRRLKLTADSASRRYLYRLDSLYLLDPAKMEKYVKEQELLRQKSLELQDQLQAVNKKIGQDTKTGQQTKKGK
jgi:hypothetical protein